MMNKREVMWMRRKAVANRSHSIRNKPDKFKTWCYVVKYLNKILGREDVINQKFLNDIDDDEDIELGSLKEREIRKLERQRIADCLSLNAYKIAENLVKEFNINGTRAKNEVTEKLIKRLIRRIKDINLKKVEGCSK